MMSLLFLFSLLGIIAYFSIAHEKARMKRLPQVHTDGKNVWIEPRPKKQQKQYIFVSEKEEKTEYR